MGWDGSVLGYHAWLERCHPQGREIVDLTSEFWPEIAAITDSVLTKKPPAYVWELDVLLPSEEWRWEPMPDLPRCLAESAKIDELEPLATQAIARA